MPTSPRLVVLVDGLGVWRDALDDPRREALDDLDRLLAEGPRHGIVMAAAADRTGSVPLVPRRRHRAEVGVPAG